MAKSNIDNGERESSSKAIMVRNYIFALASHLIFEIVDLRTIGDTLLHEVFIAALGSLNDFFHGGFLQYNNKIGKTKLAHSRMKKEETR